jgi:serine/threonine protein kinase
MGRDRSDKDRVSKPTIGTTGAVTAVERLNSRDREAFAAAKTLPSSEPAPTKIEHVGRFAIIGLLGSGGMGDVYAARDPELDRLVAIKLLHSQLSTRTDARLRREARAMARLSHPNLVTVHDVGVHDGQLFVAMELIAGQTLRSWAPGRAWRDIVRTYVAAGRGLAGGPSGPAR